MSRILLFDADVLAYRYAASNEVALEVEEDYWTWHCDAKKVQEDTESFIVELMDTLDANSYKLCLSDDKNNFRKSVLPSYKSHRSKTKKPLALKAVRQWMLEEKKGILKPTLEGDDVLGILATSPSKHDAIIISIDKDMNTIPGYHYKDGNVVEISKDEADYYHLFQTLIGDPTDGYTGCPGIGKVTAEKLLREAPTWNTVVEQYKKKNLTEDDALVQARVAKILRAEDYDLTTQQVKLWNPVN